MRKIIYLILIALVVFSTFMIGCSVQDSTDPAADTSESTIPSDVTVTIPNVDMTTVAKSDINNTEFSALANSMIIGNSLNVFLMKKIAENLQKLFLPKKNNNNQINHFAGTNRNNFINVVASSSTGNPSYWTGAHSAVIGAKNVATVIESMLAFLKITKIKPGMTMSYYRNEQLRKVKFTQIDSTYKYLIEMWGQKTDGTFEKGLEFKFNSKYKGEFVVRPWAFNEAWVSTSGPYIGTHYDYVPNYHYKVIYSNTETTRRMEIILDGAKSGKDLYCNGKGKYVVTREGNLIKIYYTGNYTNAPGQSCSINGLTWAFASHIYCNSATGVAKQGYHNGSNYVFSFDPDGTGPIPDINSVKFNSNGYIEDGYTGGDAGYPNPNDVVATSDKLTPKADLLLINIGFDNTAGPDF